jgi:predicted LPLAT superfamily acyltransferase
MTDSGDGVRQPGAPIAAWATQRERGSVLLLRMYRRLSLAVGRPVSRVILYAIAVYFFLFAPTALRNARIYLRRALGREPTARERFNHILSFATTIHDRIFLLNDRFEVFDIEVEGVTLVEAALRSGEGCFLMGAHLGSFEVMYAFGRQQPDVSIATALYQENARKVGAVLKAVNPAAAPEFIILGNIDAMLRLRARLDGGAFVNIMGDRTLVEQPVELVNFLGVPAPFPVGPWRVAALLKRPVLFIAGLYCGGNRYRVVIEEVADFSNTARDHRHQAVHEAIERYAALLERYCRAYPYNWFNFFDFWQESSTSGEPH